MYDSVLKLKSVPEVRFYFPACVLDLSLIHVGTLTIYIQDQKCPKNAKNASADTHLSKVKTEDLNFTFVYLF